MRPLKRRKCAPGTHTCKRGHVLASRDRGRPRPLLAYLAHRAGPDRDWHLRIHESTLAPPIRNVDSWMPPPFPSRDSARMRPSEHPLRFQVFHVSHRVPRLRMIAPV